MWGFVGVNNRGWYGSGGRVSFYRNVLDPPPEPIQFRPTDISNCELWLDANDPSTIETYSGDNLNRIQKWFDKAHPDPSRHFDHDGRPDTSGLYNTHYMNQLQTVYFEPNTQMKTHDGGLTFNFQARTFFAVIKPLTDLTTALSPFLNIFNGFTSGDMNTGVSYNSMTGLHSYTMCESGITCGISYDLSNNPVKQRMIIMFGQTDALDLSGNVGSYDTINQPLTLSDPADAYNTNQAIYYLNSSTHETAQDIAEIILYKGLLTSTEQTRVLDYLADKWNLSGAGQDTGGLKPSEPFYPTYGYAIYTQFVPDPPNFYWCDSLGNVESPPVLIVNYTGSTGDRDGTTYNILGTIYP